MVIHSFCYPARTGSCTKTYTLLFLPSLPPSPLVLFQNRRHKVTDKSNFLISIFLSHLCPNPTQHPNHAHTTTCAYLYILLPLLGLVAQQQCLHAVSFKRTLNDDMMCMLLSSVPLFSSKFKSRQKNKITEGYILLISTLSPCYCDDEVAARNKSDLYSELWPAMSVEACQTAWDGDVPALKTLLTNPATRAAIDQLFEVQGFGVSILKLLVDSCTISLLIVAFPIHYRVPVRGACVDAGSGVCAARKRKHVCVCVRYVCTHVGRCALVS